MTRRITEYNQLASSAFAMQNQVEDMLEKTLLAKAILGPSTDKSAYPGTFTPLADGFYCHQTTVPSLAVTIDPGTLFNWQVVDTTPFGYAPSQIAADTSNYVLKYGFTKVSDTQNSKTITPPTTPGDSRIDLVQVQLVEGDGATHGGDINGIQALGETEPVSFWQGVTGNVPNPPLTTNNFTLRIDHVAIAVKPGTPAPTGTEVAPTPDAGWYPLWLITSTNGQTSITNGNIAQHPNSIASPLDEKLPQKISLTTAQTYFPLKSDIQNSTLVYAVDSGTANAYVGTLSPALTSYVAGTIVFLKIAHVNTGASTVNLNGLGTKNIILPNGAALVGGELPVGMIAELFYDGTSFQLLSPTSNALVASASKSNTQSISPSTPTTIAFDTVDFDPNSIWNSTTKSFVPKRAGYWKISACIFCQDGDAGKSVYVDIYKNGSQANRISENPVGGTGYDMVLSGSSIVLANGTTDAFSLSAFNAGSTNVTLGQTNTVCYFQIEYIGK